MVLSDADINGLIEQEKLIIEPYEQSNIEPASVDLRMGNDLKVVNSHYSPGVPVDLSSPDGDEYIYEEVDPMVVHPGELYLATTREHIELPDNISANVLGRSSLGRLGISVHQTAGFIDPGFEGEITLEITNHGPQSVRLEPGLRICQIVFHEMSSTARNPYGHEGSQYQGQRGATESGMQFE